MNKSLVAVFIMAALLSFSFMVIVPKKNAPITSLDQAEMLAKDIFKQMEHVDSLDAYGRHLQALWSLRYFMLLYKGMENPLEAANFGRSTIENDLKNELIKLSAYGKSNEKVQKVFIQELHKDIKSFVQRTIEFFVKTNQLEVAQVVASGFTDGADFYFV